MHRAPRIRLPIVLLCAALSAIGAARPAAAAGPARIIDLAWRPQGDAVAVTVRVTAPVRFRTSTGAAGVTVDLWSVAGEADRDVPIAAGLVSSITLRRTAPHVVRLDLGVREVARVKVYTGADRVTIIAFPRRMSMIPVPQSVAYQTLLAPTGAGRARVHVVTVDPRADLAVQPALGGAVVAATETTSSAAAREAAVAAINGNFYSRAGLPLGLIVIDGRVLSAPLPRRAVFAISERGESWIGSAEFQGRLVTDDGASVPISAINRPPRFGGVALYTPEFGPVTPPHALVALVRGSRVVAFSNGTPGIPLDGYVLATAQSQQHLLLGLRRDQVVRLDLALSPDGIRQAIQGGPMLVRDGRIHIPYAWEGFGPGFVRTRTARSAIGITRGGKVLLVTVDGRNRRNSGMNLFELAGLMQRFGAREAMNLDGGGSATLVVGGRVVSALPRGGERYVSSVLVARPRPDQSTP